MAVRNAWVARLASRSEHTKSSFGAAVNASAGKNGNRHAFRSPLGTGSGGGGAVLVLPLAAGPALAGALGLADALALAGAALAILGALDALGLALALGGALAADGGADAAFGGGACASVPLALGCADAGGADV
jgi:hypothetical protein